MTAVHVYEADRKFIKQISALMFYCWKESILRTFFAFLFCPFTLIVDANVGFLP